MPQKQAKQKMLKNIFAILFVTKIKTNHFSFINLYAMRKTIRNDQNNGKALEIRLEEEGPGKFYVTVAGMTFNLRSGCASGVCGGGGEEDYMFVENETYFSNSYPTYYNAVEAYEGYKTRYLD